MEEVISFTFAATGGDPCDTDLDIKSFRESISRGSKEYCPANAPETEVGLLSSLKGLPQAVSTCIVYFTGYGGCDDKGNVYIILSEDILNEDGHVYIKDIVSCFSPSLINCQLFFELCLPNDVTKPVPQLVVLPSRKNFVIAISGVVEEGRNREQFRGGYWTRRLTETYKIMAGKCSMATMLSMAALKYKKDVNGIVSPLYTSSSYPLRPSGIASKPTTTATGQQAATSLKGYQNPTSKGHTTSKSPVVASAESAKVSSQKAPMSSPAAVGLDVIPSKQDLERALFALNSADLSTWKDKFAKRLLKVLKQNNSKLATTTTVPYFVDLLYDEKWYPTWGNVIYALEEPTKLKVTVGGNKIVIADEVKHFLGLV